MLSIGSERGVCDCGECQCIDIWTGKNCGKQNCSLLESQCKKPGNAVSKYELCNAFEYATRHLYSKLLKKIQVTSGMFHGISLESIA